MQRKQLLFDNLKVKAKPFIKWAGGKGQLLSQYETYFPKDFLNYMEPFLGGGAVYFHLAPDRAILSDINEELINTYHMVRDNVGELLLSLRTHKNEKEYYYKIRALNPLNLSPVERASRFIYLNKTCYNGLYRVNRKGQFNVPFGRYKNPLICNKEGLCNASEALQRAELLVKDFDEITLERAKSNDFIYFDPPYFPLSETSSFTSYASNGFGLEEQVKLANVFKELNKRGCFLMLSNSSVPIIRKLYQEFRIIEVHASRAISCKGEGRGRITELLILNY